MFQCVISCVAVFWMQRNTTLTTEKSSFFLDTLSHTHTDIFVLAFYHFLWVEYGQVCDTLVFHQACQGVIFWGTFWWSRCRCSTRALWLIRCWRRWWYSIWCVYQIFCDIWQNLGMICGIRIILWKGNITVEKATLEKIEKYFLGPLDSFTNEWVVNQILVCYINTMHMSVVIYNAFRLLLCHTHSSACCFNYFICMEWWNYVGCPVGC